jgi:hypothetical protein
MVSDDRDRPEGETPPRRPEDEEPPQEDHGELRFEGPISMEEDEYEDDYEGSSGGRTFLLTAIIAVAVVLIVAIALLLRDDSGPEEDELAQLGVTEEESAETGVRGEPSGDATGGATDEGLRFRSVPTGEAAPGAGEPPSSGDRASESQTTQRETARQPESTTREAPAPAEPTPSTREAEPRAAAERQSAAPEDARPARVAELARAGQVSEAARLGRRLAASGNPSHYTLQVVLACDPNNVRRAFDNVHAPQLTVLPAQYQGRRCYRLCWGDFPDAGKARAAATNVDPYFEANPVPRPWGDLLR